jgi:antitoxin (DNA-binding transcriptional repressor) of toxin-antitoxin stability system
MGLPVAEVQPVSPQRTKPRELGFAKGQFKVTDAFFEPLPDDILAAFEGREPHET